MKVMDQKPVKRQQNGHTDIASTKAKGGSESIKALQALTRGLQQTNQGSKQPANKKTKEGTNKP